MRKACVKTTDRNQEVNLLVEKGVRPTRQRMAVASYLFDGHHKHVTAEQVMAAVKKKRFRVSLATVYNTLHQFAQGGLLREIVVTDKCSYYDTNMTAHYHFFDEVTGHLWDIPAEYVKLSSLPPPPVGRKISGVDVTVRLTKAR